MSRWCGLLGACLLMGTTTLRAQENNLPDYTPPEANRPDEPLADAFSAHRAAEFLDAAALDWQASRNCMTCHTNYWYLMARPALGEGPAPAAVRRFAEELISQRWPENVR